MKTSTQPPTAPAVRRAAHLLCSAVVCLASLAIRAGAQTPDATVDLLSMRSGVVFTRAGSYDYVPSIMKQGGYRMWWCGGFGGDSIFYAESGAVAGPWHNRTSTTANTWVRVFWGTKDKNAFDSLHTCDPSVILFKGKYYLYYGGLPEADDASFSSITRIGVAVSDDGCTVGGWARQNGGLPIVSPVGTPASAAWASGTTYVLGDKVLYLGKEYVCKVNTTSSTTNPVANTTDWRKQYGAGQPSVVLGDDDWIYMFFTDSTGADSGPVNGAGIYVLRSKDPTFQTNTEELQSTGFTPIGNADSRSGTHSLIRAFSVDAVYSDVLQNFIVASNQGLDSGRLYFFSTDLLTDHGTLELPYDVDRSEGPGVVRGPEGRALPGADNDLARIPMDLIYSYQTTSGAKDPSKWDLYHVGYDLIADVDQGDLDDRVANLFRGWKIECSETPALPLAYVTAEGTRLECDVSGTPNLLTNNLYDLSDDYYHAIPFGATLHSGSGVDVWGATGRPGAFHLTDGRLWRLNDISLVTANGSSINVSVSPTTYDAQTFGPILYQTEW